MTTQTDAQSKGLWGMSRPLLVEQALQLSVPLLDTFFLSRVSDSSASGAGAMSPVIFFCLNIVGATVFSGASIASQRLGAGKIEQTNATIGTYALWSFGLGTLLCVLLYLAAPWITLAMGLPGQIRIDANTYLSIVCLLMIVWAGKLLFQSILNIFGQPQWNMMANIVFFTANVLANIIVVYGLLGFPKMGVAGVAWASVIASCIGIAVSGAAVLIRIKLSIHWSSVKREFRKTSRHIYRIALPSMMEPLSFDINMMVLNSFAAKLGAVALAAKIYTFNVFLIGLVISFALKIANEVLVCQHVGSGRLEASEQQLKQTLKAALAGSTLVALVLLALHHPIMQQFTDNEVLLNSAFVLFLLAALSEPARAINIVVGGTLRATGDGFWIAVMGPVFTWTVAIPAAYVMAFVLDWGVNGILIAAIIDESCRALMYWRRWQLRRWHHTHVHALEQQAAAREQAAPLS